MNRLTVRQRAEVLSLLCEGCSIASITRHTGTCKKAVTSLLQEAGAACASYLNEKVTKLRARRVQMDEIFSYVYMKEKRVPETWKGFPGLGDTWLWLAIDTESKLVITYRVGRRGSADAIEFVKDLASRLVDRIQLSSDGHRPYIEAVEKAFYSDSVDYAMIAKHAIVNEGEVSEGYAIFGDPDPKYINTSYIERYNLTVRMTDRRFTRKTNAFSKSIDNHIYSVALHIFYYNFCRHHMAIKMTPAMASGLERRQWYYEDIVEMVDRAKIEALKPSGVVRIKR